MENNCLGSSCAERNLGIIDSVCATRNSAYILGRVGSDLTGQELGGWMRPAEVPSRLCYFVTKLCYFMCGMS